MIDVSLGRSAATDMGVADPTFLMIPTVPLHVGKHMVSCKLGPELGPTMGIADSKMLSEGTSLRHSQEDVFRIMLTWWNCHAPGSQGTTLPT